MIEHHADIELRILSQPRYLCVARGAICAALSKIGFPEQEAGEVTVALDEALANIIRHGYNGREDQPIWIRFTPQEQGDRIGFEMVIEDQTSPADPSTFVGRDLDDVRPGGLGVNIIKRVMDDAIYTQRPEGGMRLTLTKSIVAQAKEETTHE